jgi:2-phospho-L-lactate/phosphoenolpyruvate guanylyltransferase
VSSGYWDIIVPLKDLTDAKSRMAEIDPHARRALAQAMAMDTVSAVVRCRRPIRLHVACRDSGLIESVLAVAPAARVHHDAPEGLNEALAFVSCRLSDAAEATVALVGDLPALRARHLARALDQIEPNGRFTVADRRGTGSTMLASSLGLGLRPAFGPGSFWRHVDSGAVPIDAAHGLRCDVDTVPDLIAAISGGVGAHTARVVARRLRDIVPMTLPPGSNVP